MTAKRFEQLRPARPRSALALLCVLALGLALRLEVVESGVMVEGYWATAGVKFEDIQRLDTGGMKS